MLDCSSPALLRMKSCQPSSLKPTQSSFTQKCSGSAQDSFAPEGAALLLKEYAAGKRTFTRAMLRKNGLYITAPNLENADLSRACLFQIELNQANLQGCNFSRAQLRRAELMEANLSGANLSGTDLCRANLSRANLRNACLVGANLSDALLMGADLRGADLRNANLSHANLQNAIFAQTLMPDGSVRNR